mgnify:CR=1 FL=1
MDFYETGKNPEIKMEIGVPALTFHFSCFFLIWYKKENWKPSLVFMLYLNVLITLSFLNIQWIDADLLRLALAAFIPICLGITVAIVMRLMKPLFKHSYKYKYLIASISSIILFVGIIPLTFIGTAVLLSQKTTLFFF